MRLLKSWSSVRRYSIAALSTGLVVSHLLVLLESGSPLRRSSICSDQGRSSVYWTCGQWLARPSLVCRWCVVGVSLTCLLVCCWSICLSASGSSLSCTSSWSLVRRSSICSCIARASARPLLVLLFVRRWSAVGPSVGVVVTGAWFVHRSSVYSSRRCAVTRLLSVLFRFCSTVRLAALRAFLFSLLVEFGRHAVHTHSVPRVVSRHFVITHSLFHSCSPSGVLLESFWSPSGVLPAS